MQIPRGIRNYLFQHKVAYARYVHAVAYTAQEIAHTERVPGGEFAKTVVLHTDDRLILAVLPDDHVINLEMLKRQIGCGKLSIALEEEFIGKFRECQPGAMPPFGNLFKLPLYCDTVLAKHAEIEFNAGTHDETIRMKYAAFVKLENPIILSFSEKRFGQPAARVA
jgi:Ala-tRNA(Pro) deacylase